MLKAEALGTKNGDTWTLSMSEGNNLAATVTPVNYGDYVDYPIDINNEVIEFDFVSPEITYLKSESSLDKGNKKLSVIFNVTDDNFSYSTLQASNITVSINGATATVESLTEVQDVTATVDGTEKTIGKQYELVISNISNVETTETVTITIPKDIAYDEAGNTNLAKTITTNFVETDKENPSMVDLNVTSPETGTYKQGEVITIKAIFDEYVYDENGDSLTEDTAPVLNIKFGEAAEKTATFDEIDGNTITYTYEIVNGDNGVLSLVSYNGTVYDKAGNAVDVTADSMGGFTITADTIEVTLEDLSVISPETETYKAGQEITIKATYSENIYSDTTATDLTSQTSPVLNIKFGDGEEKEANFISAEYNEETGKEVITYKYTIISGDNGTLTLESYTGTVCDIAGNELVLNETTLNGEEITADTEAPILDTIKITTPNTGYYTVGQEITIEATFSENIYDVSRTTLEESTAPKLNIKFGSNEEKETTFKAVDGNKITYTYTVENEDNGILTVSSYTGTVYDIALTETDANGNKLEITTKDLDESSNQITADTIIPEWKYVSKEVFYTDLEAGNDEYVNDERTVKLTFSGTDLNYASNTLNDNVEEIKVLVNGTDITENVTKTLEQSDESTNGIQYTLTIIGITGDGDLSVVIPQNTLIDAAGNKNTDKTFSTDLAIDADNTEPTLNSIEVTSPATGKYRAGQLVEIVATYSNETLYSNAASTTEVTTSTAPSLKLKFGESVVRDANCTLVNGNQITYTYEIQAEDNGVLAIESYTGTIYDRAGNALVVNSRALTGYNITADTLAPTFDSIKVTSPENGTYKQGQLVTIQATFSENIYGPEKATLIENTAPTLKVKFDDGIEKQAKFKSVSENTITYEYTIASGDNGKLVAATFTGTVYDIVGTTENNNGNSLELSTKDFAEDSKIIIADTFAPTLENINVLTPTTGIYKTGQLVTIQATYNENIYGQGNIALTESTAPILNIKLGDGTQTKATFKEVSGNTITYTYRIVDGDNGLLVLSSYSGTVYDGSKTINDINGNSLTVSVTGNDITLGENEITADTILPVWTYKSKQVMYADPETGTNETAGNDQYVNSERIIDITFTGTDLNYKTNTLSSNINEIKVLVNGTDITDNVSKNIESVTNIDNGVECKLRITGITGNGYVSIVIPGNTIEDLAKTTDDSSGNKNIATTFTTTTDIDTDTDLDIEADNTIAILQSINVISPVEEIYKQGQEIKIVATFNEDIYGDVGSKNKVNEHTAPTLNIKFGNGTEREAIFSESTNTTITYKVEVKAGDNGELTTTSYNGNVYDRAGNALEVSNKTLSGNKITADTTAPTLDKIKITSPETGTYKAGQEITIEATYSENIYSEARAELTEDTAPVLNIKFGNSDEKPVTFKEVNGNVITYKYTIVQGDNGELTTSNYTGTVYDVAKTESDSNGNELTVTVKDLDSTSKVITADTEAPVLDTIKITTPNTGYYTVGQEITIEATFSENVYASENATLTENTVPKLNIKFGDGEEKETSFKFVNGNKITYTYTIENGDNGELTTSSYTGTVYDVAKTESDSNGNALTVTVKELDENSNKITADTIIPEWKYVSKEVFYTDQEAGNDSYVNKERTVKLTFAGTDLNYKDNALDENVNLIKVLVNGTDITGNVTKTLSEQKSITNGIEYTLTITGITGDGYLSVVLPQNTVEDLAGNKNIDKTFSTDLAIDADNTLPTLNSIEVTSPEDGIYKAGQLVTIVATYSNETLYSNAASTNEIDTSTAPSLKLKFGESAVRDANCILVNENQITYTYEIQAEDNGALAIESYSGTIYDRAGNALVVNSRALTGYNITADTLAPTFDSIKVTSPENGTYKAGQQITIEATYSENVYGTSRELLTESTAPELKIKFGNGEERTTTFVPSEEEKNILTYTYEIQSGDNGVVTTSSYTGKVYDIAKTEEDANGNSLELSNKDFAEDSKIITADTTAPTLQSVKIVEPDTGIYKAGQVVTIEATYNENVYGQGNTLLTESVAPILKIKLGDGEEKTATFVPKDTKSDVLTYTYEIKTGDNGNIASVSYTGTVYDGSETENDSNGNALQVSNLSLSGNEITADTTNPVWKYESKEVKYLDPNTNTEVDVGNEQYVNAQRVVKITFTGTDLNYKDNILDEKVSEIKVLVNGQDITSNVIKDLSTEQSITNGIRYTLSITGITGNGYLSVVIPENTLEDLGKTTSDSTGNKNIAATFTTTTDDDTDTDLDIEADNTASILQSIYVSTPTTSIYKEGQEITIVATYNEDIFGDVTSKNQIDEDTAPVLKIKFGDGVERTATFKESTSTTITYAYTIKGKTENDEGDNGELVTTSYAGTVYDKAGNELAVSSMTLTGSIITADTTAPTFDNIIVETPDTGTYKVGQEITFKATYSENIYGPANATLTENTAPVLNVKFGEAEQEKSARFKEINVNVITYTYTVEAGDTGVLVTSSYIGTVYDIAKTTADGNGNALTVSNLNLAEDSQTITADTTSPTLNSINVISPETETYKAGQEILIEATYSENVYGPANALLADGTAPVLNIKFGDGDERTAIFVPSEIETNVLTYKYTIQTGDNGVLTSTEYTGTVYDIAKTTSDPNGNELEVSNMTLGGYVITADTSAPELQSINVIKPSTGIYRVGQEILIEATYNENVYAANRQIVTADTAPTLKIKFGESDERITTFVPKDTVSNVLIYTYTVQEGDDGALATTSYTGTVYDLPKTEDDENGNALTVSNKMIGGNAITADTTVPVWTYKSKQIVYQDTQAGNDEYANAERKVLLTFTGTDTNYETNTLKENINSIKVLVDGVDITDNVTKELNNPAGVTQGIEYTLSITGITGEGYLTVVIPKNTLEDKAILTTVDEEGVETTDTVGNRNLDTTFTTTTDNDTDTDIDIEADNIPPVFESMSVITPETETYKAGQEITIEAVYGENIFGEITSNDEVVEETAPVLKIKFGDGAERETRFSSIRYDEALAKDVIVYKYTIQAQDNGVIKAIAYTGTVYDRAGNPLVLNLTEENITNNYGGLQGQVITADTTAPTLNTINVTSPDAGIYKAGQVVTIQATYSEVVYGTSRSVLTIDTAPELKIKFEDGTERTATFNPLETAGNVLTYTYTVQDEDNGTIQTVSYEGTVYDVSKTTEDSNGNALEVSNVTIGGNEIIADTILPIWKYVSKEIKYVDADVGNDEYANAERRVLLTFTGTDLNYRDNTLDENVDLIKVFVDGNDITENVTKDLSDEKTIENGIEYTLEITGITGDGYLSVLIPANTIEDLGKTTDDASGNKNIDTTFSTTTDVDTDTDLDIEADNTDPILESIEVIEPETETYKAGQQITFVATYNEDIYGDVTSINQITEGTAPVLNIKFGESDERTARFVESTARTITYTYTIQTGDDGILEVVSYTGTVYDRAGNDLVLTSRRTLSGSTITADTTNPELQTIKVITPETGTYKAGQQITIEATYSENVYGTSRELLTESTAPELNIKFGSGEERETIFVPKDTESNVLTYTYTIVSGDNGELVTTAYTGTVYDVSKTTNDSNGNLLEVSNLELAEDSQTIIADTTSATLESINVIEPATELYKAGQVITIEATYNENVYGQNNTILTESTAPILKVKFVDGTEKTAIFKDAADNKVRYTCTVIDGDNGILNLVSYVGTVYDVSKTTSDSTGNPFDVNVTSENTSLGGNTITADTILPVWTYVSKDIRYEQSEVGNDEFANESRTVNITFKGTDLNYETNTLDKDVINVFVNGTDITSDVEKTLSVETPIENGIEYTLTIKGITGDGDLSVVIPAGTLEDKSFTTEDSFGNKNISTTFSTDLRIDADNTSPDIQSINVISPTYDSETEEGLYRAGQEINIKVIYVEPIFGDVTSINQIDETTAPILKLNFDEEGILGAERTATFKSSDETSITYTYTIQNGDNGRLVTTSYEGTVYDRAGNKLDVANETLGGYVITADTTNPVWRKVVGSEETSFVTQENGTILATAKIEVTGTDKYFQESTLTIEDITVIVDNTVVDTDVNISGPTEIENGVQYEVTVTGFAANANQVRILIDSNTLEDRTVLTTVDGEGNQTTTDVGNKNVASEKNSDFAASDKFIMHNSLKLTDTETEATSNFLGNENLQRTNVAGTVFESSIENANETAWDVSAQQDNSIIAWYDTDEDGEIIVHIGSNDQIHANTNSTNLFLGLGYSTSKFSIQNIELLNTNNVTIMDRMFKECGFNSMTSLNLGSNFYTYNVTSMSGMFQSCGDIELESIDFGNNFDTSNVTDMSYMFSSLGKSSNNFTTLDLTSEGINFDTSKVTNMEGMFKSCGYTGMESLNLGNKFNTRNVTNMKSMFEECGFSKLTSLYLGKYFDTRKVTNMTNMFYKCGSTVMTELDLGQAFIKIADNHTDFVTNCGKDSLDETLIHAAESIYNDIHNFKLNKDVAAVKTIPDESTDYINYTRGKINPKYKLQWTKVSNEIITDSETGEKSMNIVINGTDEYESYESNTLTDTDIKVYVDGELVESIAESSLTGLTEEERAAAIENKVIVRLSEGTNTEETVGENTVVTGVDYTVTLSNFEQDIRHKDSSDVYKHYLEWTGNVSLEIAAGTLQDKYESSNLADIIEDEEKVDRETQNKMFIDDITPEFSYKFSSSDINYTDKSLTVVFNVTDKYISDYELTKNEITVIVDGSDEANGKVTKDLTPGDLIKVTINGEERTVGRTYTLVIEDLENLDVRDANGNYVNYSGPISLVFAGGILSDNTGNTSVEKTITIGLDDPIPPGTDTEGDIVDVVDPVWNYESSAINRTRDGKTENNVELTLHGVDKYFKQSLLTEGNIEVYIDDTKVDTVTASSLTDLSEEEKAVAIENKVIVAINSPSDLLEDRTEKVDGEDVTKEVLYGAAQTITLSNFGTDYEDYGVVKVKIAAGTLIDNYNNLSQPAEFLVGNPNWVEAEDDTENPTYLAFRNNVVDYVDPIFKYQYSNVEATVNPEIDYANQKLTVKFNVTDKYFLNTTLPTGTDTNVLKDYIRILVDGQDITTELGTNLQVATITNGVEYTLEVTEFEKADNGKYKDYSGPVQLVFVAGKVSDTSGNKNISQTITIDYDKGDDTDNPVNVDVIKPVWKKVESSITRTRTGNAIDSVQLKIQGTDKYYASNSLKAAVDTGTVKVLIVNAQNQKVENEDVVVELSEPTILDEDREFINETTGNEDYGVEYTLTLTNFGEYSGEVYVIIPAETLVDTSQNKNKQAEFSLENTAWVEDDEPLEENETGYPKYNAFRNNIIDFVKPVWTKTDSTINRTRDGKEIDSVEIVLQGTDKHYLENNLQLKEDEVLTGVKVYIKDTNNEYVESTTIQKALSEPTDITNGVEYTLTLTNFENYSGEVAIEIVANTLVDTSGNKNDLTEKIDVSSEDWEDSLVDFIKPIVTDAKIPELDYANKKLTVSFDVTDKFFKSSTLQPSDLQIVVDETDITSLLNVSFVEENGVAIANGLRYTVEITGFEQITNLLETGKEYLDYSGLVKVVIPAGKISDTSLNLNDKTEFTVSEIKETEVEGVVTQVTEPVIVDFVNPLIYVVSNETNGVNLTATIVVNVTDKYYDLNQKLTLDNFTLTANDGRDIKTVYAGKIDFVETALESGHGYQYSIIINEYEEDALVSVDVPANVIKDQYNNYNRELGDNAYILDNRSPIWKYISTDSEKLDSEGTIIFKVKAQDRNLIDEEYNYTAEALESSDIIVYCDGNEVASTANITVTQKTVVDNDPRENPGLYDTMEYEIKITGLSAETIGTYTLVLDKGVVRDVTGNVNNRTTLTFSKTVISSQNYTEVTYFTSPDEYSFVNEPWSIDSTGTNTNSETYLPSSLGNLNAPETLKESFAYLDGVQTAKSFKGWAEANENGLQIGETVYGLYDEVPNTIRYLRAVWQDAKVIFISKDGNDSNDGLSPTTPVNTLETAFDKLSSLGDISNQIVVIMDEITWGSSNDGSRINKPATITSLYGGVDYREKNDAVLKIDANMSVQASLRFDDIVIESLSNTVADRTTYLANGAYTNLLIMNHNELIIGRGVSSPEGKYTFGAIIGGNYQSDGTIKANTMIIERGTYNNIIAGSIILGTPSNRSINHNVQLGSKKDASVGLNNKLEITGYFTLGQNEGTVYPVDNIYSSNYVTVNLYSGTFTAESSWNSGNVDAALYMTSMGTTVNGKVKFNMYGGEINGNIFAGEVLVTDTNYTIDEKMTTMNFYAGQVIGDIFGQGSLQDFTGSSEIYLTSIFKITGDIYGGSNNTSGTANTNITISGSSVIVDGNIYGANKGSGTIDGTTNIYLNGGTITGTVFGGSNRQDEATVVTESNINFTAGNITNGIYGGSNGAGTVETSNINLISGTIPVVYGGGYKVGVETANINLEGTATVDAIYGGPSVGGTVTTSNINLKSGTALTVFGGGLEANVINANVNLEGGVITTIYGGSSSSGTVENAVVNLKAGTIPTVYGGGLNASSQKATVNLEGATATTIYGGPKSSGTVTEAIVNLTSGTATTVYGGGQDANVDTATVNLQGATIQTAVYGGPNSSGVVEEANVNIKSGSVPKVFGGGTQADVTTSNVSFEAGTVEKVYGGPGLDGTVMTSNVFLKSETIETVFGGGNSGSVGTSNVTLQGATVGNIYGGPENDGIVSVSNVFINSGTVTNVFGGGLNADTTDTNVTFDGTATLNGNIFGGSNTSGTVTNTTINMKSGTLGSLENQDIEIFGGGLNSGVGTESVPGTITVNILGGTMYGNINGGSKQSNSEAETLSYANIDINIGKEAIGTEDEVGIVNINKNIYGAGSSVKAYDGTVVVSGDYETYTSVEGNININFDGTDSTINIAQASSIYGSGNVATYEGIANINIKDFGIFGNTPSFTSIQRASLVNFDNSCIELIGVEDYTSELDDTDGMGYTFNRIDNLTLGNNTTVFLREGINIVKEYNSIIGFDENGNYKTDTNGNTHQVVTIDESGIGTTNGVNNRIYVMEGKNLWFANVALPWNVSAAGGEVGWSDINGMTFFGKYAFNRTGSGENFWYDIYHPTYTPGVNGAIENFFQGAAIYGKHKSNHNIEIDGFYTNIGDFSNQDNVTITQEFVQVYLYDNEKAYQWGEEGFEALTDTIIAKTYQPDEQTMLSIPLTNEEENYYEPGTIFEIVSVSVNSLEAGVELVDPLSLPIMAEGENANTRFGLELSTETGWLRGSKTEIQVEGNSQTASIIGDTKYVMDHSGIKPTFNFRLYSSYNITEAREFGNITISVNVTSADGEALGVKQIALSLKSVLQANGTQYRTSFTNAEARELKYTHDSKVDITYMLYKSNAEETIYASGDYRVLSSNYRLPVGTKLTMVDYGQAGTPSKAYYYRVENLKTADANGKYIYPLSDFIEMGNINDEDKKGYTNGDDNSLYYDSEGKQAGERYDIEIDFKDARITTNVTGVEVAMELRDSSNATKFDSRTTVIFDLLAKDSDNKTYNATLSQTLSSFNPAPDNTETGAYTLNGIVPLNIEFNFNAHVAERIVDEINVRDTKYYGQNTGVVVELVDAEMNQKVDLTAADYLEVDGVKKSAVNGFIRYNLSDSGIATIIRTMNIHIEPKSVVTGDYILRLHYFASDDGEYYGIREKATQEIKLRILSPSQGFKADIADTNRIIYSSTGKGLNDESNLTFDITSNQTIAEACVTVSLYKRNATYTDNNFADVTYTLVDFKQYFENSLDTTEEENMVISNDYEYIISSDGISETPIEFIADIQEGISTGEYKLEFKLYSEETLLETITKTFVVIK